MNGRLLSINPAAAHSLGYEPEQGVGSNLAEFLAPETRHLFDGYLQRIRDLWARRGLMRVIPRDGRARVWMYRNVLYGEPGGAQYVLGHALDITDRSPPSGRFGKTNNVLRGAHAELDRRVQDRDSRARTGQRTAAFEIVERNAPRITESGPLSSSETCWRSWRGLRSARAGRETRRAAGGRADLPVPFAADWTMIHVQTEDGAIRSEAGVHLDPARAPHAGWHGSPAYLASLPAGSLLARTIASGHVLFISDSTGDLATRVAGRGEPVPLLQALGVGSVAIVPLVAQAHLESALLLGATSTSRYAGSGRIVIEDLARQFRLALDRIQLYRDAQDANRLKDEFLSTLSHELRTPLMLSSDGRESSACVSSTRHGACGGSDRAQRHAQLRLIEDVLDVSRIITGKMALRWSAVSIGDVLAATIDGVRPAAEAKGVRLDALWITMSPRSAADPQRLQQVLWNVLSNALKFTRADDVITVARDA